MHAFFPYNDWFICAGNLEQSLGEQEQANGCHTGLPPM
jgi:hypothetical protein